MNDSELKIVYQGIGGYIEYGGYRYVIELIGDGFCIYFPNGNRHGQMQEHLNVLKEFAESRGPEWYVENRTRKDK